MARRIRQSPPRSGHRCFSNSTDSGLTWGNEMGPKYLTVDEVAAELNTTIRFVRRLIEERRIAFHHIGRHVRINRADLDAFVAAGRVEARRAA
ncbi:helix-turn-helix domain-containing protein [Actinokineospora sp. UTMC 2448]|uniref:helix-turn-helix domain-containing protein n=1 Tax=Actinokineospora sp. UTMC 2448 TaxID=2268449 RepID=UPI002868B7EF|nr:helix-turn-helix domain-containing protein [Actinokineospora sp. UTMC 2448]